MTLKKLAVISTACLFAATPAIAAEWSEFDASALPATEQAETQAPAAAVVEDEIHASSTTADKPADGGEKKSDSNS